jgi:hypothetical protein
MLEIALEKACFIIAKAREFDVKVEASEPEWGTNPADDEGATVLEEHGGDLTPTELKDAIETLNEAESLNLVALMWLGRGDFTADEWDDALKQARTDRSAPTADYLMGTPLLPDFLEEGLSLLGLSCEGVT